MCRYGFELCSSRWPVFVVLLDLMSRSPSVALEPCSCPGVCCRVKFVFWWPYAYPCMHLGFFVLLAVCSCCRPEVPLVWGLGFALRITVLPRQYCLSCLRILKNWNLADGRTLGPFMWCWPLYCCSVHRSFLAAKYECAKTLYLTLTSPTSMELYDQYGCT